MFKRFLVPLILITTPILLSHGQVSGMGEESYDDYGAFATDPVDLDQEVADLFGRYFQMTFLAGSLIPNGDLGAAYGAGAGLGIRFVLYHDKIWAVEMGGMWARHEGKYNSSNTETENVDISMRSTMIPLAFGFRYGFDLDSLPRGIALMHPYLSAGPEIIFRSESVKSGSNSSGLPGDQQERFVEKSVRNTTGYGFHFGGGIEFDIYRKKLFLGTEARYHFLNWSDGDDFVGQLGRQGHIFGILGTLNYNY